MQLVRPWALWLSISIGVAIALAMVLQGIIERPRVLAREELFQKLKQITIDDIKTLEIEEPASGPKTGNIPFRKEDLIRAFRTLEPFQPSHPAVRIVINVSTGPDLGFVRIKLFAGLQGSTRIAFVDAEYRSPIRGVVATGTYSSPELLEWFTKAGFSW